MPLDDTATPAADTAPSVSLDTIRQKYPQYNDLSDDALARGMHGKFYADMPFDTFAGKIGYSTKPTPNKTFAAVDEWGNPVDQALPEVPDQPRPRGYTAPGKAYTSGMDWRLQNAQGEAPGTMQDAARQVSAPQTAPFARAAPSTPRQAAEQIGHDTPSDFYPDGTRVPGQNKVSEQSWNDAVRNAGIQGVVGSVGAVPMAAGQVYRAAQTGAATDVLRGIALIDQGKITPAIYQDMGTAERAQVSAYLRATPDERQQMKAEMAARVAAAEQPNAAIRAGERITAAGEKEFPVDKTQEGLGTHLARAIGQAPGIVGATALGTAAAGPAGGILAGSAMIGAQVYPEVRAEAVAKGASSQDADRAASLSSLANMGVMGLPIAHVLRATPELPNMLLNALTTMAKNGVEFGSFNTLATFATNFVAKSTYNPDQALLAGTPEAALEGVVTGMLFGVPGAIRGYQNSAARMRMPFGDADLGDAYRTQQQAAAGAQARPNLQLPGPAQPSAPPAPPSAAPPPAPPAPKPPAPPSPHDVLTAIAQTGQPPAPAPPAATPPAPKPPAPPPITLAPSPVVAPPPAPELPATPPATPESGPPRSPSQIQREDGVGHNEAVKRAAAEGWTPPSQTPPPPVPPSDPDLVQKGRALADEWERLGNQDMADAVRAGANMPGLQPSWLAFNEQKLAQAKSAADPNAPKPPTPIETFSLDNFMQDNGKAAAGAWSRFQDIATPEAKALADQVQRAGQGLTDQMNALGKERATAHIGSPEGAALKKQFGDVMGSFSRYQAGHLAIQSGYKNANPAREAVDQQNLVTALTQAGYPPEMSGESAPPVLKPPAAVQESAPASDKNPRPTPPQTPRENGTRPPPPVESAPKPPDRPADYGANNQLVTTADADAIRSRLRAKAAALRGGVDPSAPGTKLAARPGGMDPETMLDGSRLAVYHLEAGTRSFADYARAMIEDVGEEFRPYLRMWYEGARYYPGLDASDLTPHAEVEAEIARWGAQEGSDEQGSRSGDGGLGETGSGPTGQGGGESGQPVGDRPTGALAPQQSTDVPSLEPGGAGEGAGVRPLGSDVSSEAPIHPGGDAADGRPRGSDEGVAPDGAGAGADNQPVSDVVRPNFHIDDPERLIGGTPKVRFARNRAALEALANIEEEQRHPTTAELETMAGYIGWGSFGQDLFQGSFEKPVLRKGWDAEAQWLRDHLGKERWQSAQRSIINAHYTDPPTVQTMWDMAQHMGFRGGRVLEPAMGIGNFFGMMPRDIMGASTLTGIELDHVTGAMAKLLYPDAGIHIKGYEASSTPDDFYDMVIGNWPFAAMGPSDNRYNRMKPSLHDYFFLKALDQVRPGGLVMGITSAGTMDKAGRSVRLDLAKNADLVAAFRLPSGAFEKYAGTSVVTDILVFRKRASPNEFPTQVPWVEATEMDTPAGQKIRVNRYFQDHPEAVLGTLDWGRGTTSGTPGMIVHRPDDLMARLAGLPARLPTDGYHPTIRGKEPRFLTNNTTDRQNSVVIHDNGQLYQVQGDRLMPLRDVYKPMRSGTAKEIKAREDQVHGLVGLRKTYGALIDAERDGNPQADAIRVELAKRFGAFRDKHGSIAGSAGLRVLDKIQDPARAIVEALEKPDGTPSRILSEPTVRARRSIENPSIPDAYVLARNEQAIFDMARVAELAKQPQSVVEQRLLDSGAVMRTPGGGFQPADQYLSGNVRRKLAEAKQAVERGDVAMQASVDALTKAVPPTVPYYLIEAKMGATWVGDDAYKQFVAELLGLPGTKDLELTFAAARWKVRFADPAINHSEQAERVHGHPRRAFNKIIQDALSNNAPRIMDPADDDGGPYFNPKATEEVNAKIQALRERFTDWAWADPERKVLFEAAYNETMNAIAKPQFDGSFMDMSGMALKRGDDPFSLRRHQVNAIWRGVVLGRGLFAHEVGTGKTYTMGGIAVEGRRYGVHRKPLVFAHNANSASVAREMQEMYPGGQFLFVDNLAPAQIATTMRRIANEDWDAIIMPHSLIDNIGMTRETLNELAAEQIAQLETEAMAAAQEDGANLTVEMMDDEKAMKKVRSPTAKSLVKARQAIIKKIEELAAKAARPDAIPFEHLGVDAVIVDEAHEFKKPPFATKMRLKGLNTATSNRSISLNFITGYVKKNNNGRGVYLFTGTPVTNTLSEIFNQSRYFMDDKLEQAGVKEWDAWFNTFADATADVELGADGQFEPVKRLAAFVNVDELVRMMSEFTDVVQAKDMPEFQPRATADGKTLHSPDLTPEDRDFLTNGRTEKAEGRPYKHIITDVAEMSPAQRAILDDIRERVASFKAASGKERKEIMYAKPPDRRAPLITDQDGPKASQDARMYDPDAPDDPNSKGNRIARTVLKIYHDEPKAGQAVFVDIGYNAVKSSEGRENRFVMVQDFIAKLVRGGIPRDQIAIVGGGISPEKKAAIAKEMGVGTKRVVIGRSDTLGVGVNMQPLLRAMHHWDAPWRPGDLTQRNGRGERQGNTWNTVREYRYITENIDGRRWQVLTAKERFINQFINAFNDTSGKRIGNLEGDAADMSEDEDFTATLTAAAGDPRIMIRAKLRADVDRLARRERLHTVGQAEAIARVRSLDSQRQGYLREEAKYTRWAQTWQQHSDSAEGARAALHQHPARLFDATSTPGLQGGVSVIHAAHGRVPFHRQHEIQDAIDVLVRELRPGDQQMLARINSFTVWADWSKQTAKEPLFYIDDPDGNEVGQIQLPTVQRVVNRLNSMADAAAAARHRYDETGKAVEALQGQAKMAFPQAENLLKKRTQLMKLETDLQANPTPPPSWLRHGAPIDSEIYVDGKPRIVRGHHQGEDYTLGTDEGEVPYMQAKDENGTSIFEQHPPPPRPKPKAAPEWVKSHVAATKDGELVWHDGDLALVRGTTELWGAPETMFFGFKKDVTPEPNRNQIGMMAPKGFDHKEWEALANARDDWLASEANRQAIEAAAAKQKPTETPAKLSTAHDEDLTGGTLSLTGGRQQIAAGRYARRKKTASPALAPAATPPEAQAARARLATAATGMMRFIGLPEKVGLTFVESLPIKGRGVADAMYDSQKALITYALDTDAKAAPVRIWHEAIHALMDPNLGLLNEAQRKALVAGGKRWLHDGRRGVARRRELAGMGYGPDQMVEEAIARLAEDALTRGTQPRTLTGIAIERMHNFALGMGQVFHGEKYLTAEDVMRGLLRGERALPGSRDMMREATQQQAGQTPTPAPVATTAPVPHQAASKPAAKPVTKPTPSMTQQLIDEEFPPEGTKTLNDVLAEPDDEKYAMRRRPQGPRETVVDVVDDIQKIFSPTSRGAAKDMEQAVRHRAARQARSGAVTGHALERFRHLVGRLTEAQKLDFTHRMETNQRQVSPQLQAVADVIRRLLDFWTRKIQSLPGDHLQNADAFYMGRIYSNHEEWAAGLPATPGGQAQGLSGAIGAGISKRPIRGSGNFLKKRRFDTLKEAMDAGLIPVTTNPIDMQILKLREMQRYYHGTKLGQQIKDSGLSRWVPVEQEGRAKQLGLVVLNDPFFQPKTREAAHGLNSHGNWYAPEMLARIFNNYVSEGWSGRSTLYDMIRASGNLLNSVQLGLSGFHATFIGIDTMMSQVALGLQQAINHGDVIRGAGNIVAGATPLAAITTIRRGNRLRAAYLDPQSTNPEMRKILEMFLAGGGRINMDQFYRSNASGSFFKTLTDLKNPLYPFREAWEMLKDTPYSGAFRIFGRLMDTMMEPIMGQMVPRAKAGVFAALAADWIRRNPQATPQEMAAAAIKMQDSIDNRMGQMVYDNQYWKKTHKDLAFIATRSVGWNVGTIREIGGAGVDAVRQIGNAARGQRPELTHRMAYTVAMALVSALIGAVMTYLYTGRGPQELTDYFYPPDGQGGRMSFPGYVKDIVAYWHDFVGTLLNKVHPMASMASQLYHNRDYTGDIIDHPRFDDALPAYLTYLSNQVQPFSLRAQQKLGAQGAPAWKQGLAFMGVQPAPASIVNPEKSEHYQQFLDDQAYRRRERHKAAAAGP